MVFYLNENILEEAVSGKEVVDALNDKIGVLITYDDEKYHRTGKRYIEPYVYGLTKSGNPCIRAYQYFGDTKRGVPKWKLFRLDRVQSWEPTQQHFELEPQARGWAAQAYNNNGDNSMSAVYQTVELGNEALTDYEKLKAQVQQIKNSTPLNISQFKERMKPNPEVQPTYQKPEPPGPITGNTTNPNVVKANDLNNNSDFQDMLKRNLAYTEKEKAKRNKSNVSKPLNGQGNPETNTNQPPIKQEPKQTGPIIGNTTNPTEVKASDIMNDDEFKKMIQRNLEITQQEKQRRLNRANNLH